MVAVVAAALLVPGALAHANVRHDDMNVRRTAAGDAFLLDGFTADWRVVSPRGSVFEGFGAALAVPAGEPADGTWAVHAKGVNCGAANALTLRWVLGRQARSAPFPDCGDVLWVFNWSPIPVGGSYVGTILLVGPGPTVRMNSAEAQEATIYQDATPYYNVEAGNPWDGEYLLLLANGNVLDEDSFPGTDDDGDGIPNRGDRDSWAEPWLRAWAQDQGLDWDPDVPNAAMAVEDATRELARGHPALAPVLGGRVDYATGDMRGEPAHATPAGAREVLAFTVHNEVAVPDGPGLSWYLLDVLVDVPQGAAGPRFAVDLAATRAMLPSGWSAWSWDDGGRTRVLYQGTWYSAAHGGEAKTLPLVATAAGEIGPAMWDVTMLFADVEQRRFAFVPAEVVAP